MTPEDFAAKVEELRAVIADKIADLEENPAWGSGDDRQEVIQALDELIRAIRELAAPAEPARKRRIGFIQSA